MWSHERVFGATDVSIEQERLGTRCSITSSLDRQRCRAEAVRATLPCPNTTRAIVTKHWSVLLVCTGRFAGGLLCTVDCSSSHLSHYGDNGADVSGITGGHRIYTPHDAMAAHAAARHVCLQQHLLELWHGVRLSCLRLRSSLYAGPSFGERLWCLSELEVASSKAAQTGN